MAETPPGAAQVAVLDANVVGAWSFPEAGTPEARAVLRLIVSGRLSAFVPELFWAEFQHICGRKLQDAGVSEGDVDLAYRDAGRLPLTEVPVLVSLRSEAWRLRRSLGIGSYDSYYLALALELGADVWTLDREFVDRAGGGATTSGRVKLVGRDVPT